MAEAIPTLAKIASDYIRSEDFQRGLEVVKTTTTKVLELIRKDLSQRKVDQLIAARLAARAQKNWAESDRIRDELLAMGIALKDNKDGTTTWEVKR